MQTIPNLEQQSEAAAAGTRSVPRSASGLVALEGGRVQRGALRGQIASAEGDLIFTTAATGWGEILTDPSYAGQIVVLTHPMAGNYRIAAAELESSRVHARALICSRLVTPPDGPGISLEELLVEAGIPALTGIDTRALTLELRRGVLRRAVIRPAGMTDDAPSPKRVPSRRGHPSTTSPGSGPGIVTASPPTECERPARPSSTTA